MTTGDTASDHDEARRLAALHRYAILDTPEDAAFDRLCALARQVFGTPTAAVTLVDGDREWVKARVGLDLHEWPRAWAFYPHLADDMPIAGETYVLPDVAQDDRFKHNPLIAGSLRMRFLAGSPLYSPDNLFLGMMVVGSPEPRPAGLSQQHKQCLAGLAAIAVDELELRLQRRLAQEAAARAA